MLARNRLILLMGLGGALAALSYSLQYLQLAVSMSPMEGGNSGPGKSRKRLTPVLLPPSAPPDPLAGAYHYCNTPQNTQQTWEGHSPADYQLLSVQVMIRHGDRYPLYSIPRTRKPPLDCTLNPKKEPSHPLLSSFISHMTQEGRDNWDTSLASLPRLPNHSSCEMGELTQTGVVQHLRNGHTLRSAYLRGPPLLARQLGAQDVVLETTGRSRTLQSGLALLYGLLPGDEGAAARRGSRVRLERSALFCGRSCDCPARQYHMEAEQRRQYRSRVADTRLDRTYVTMANALGVTPRALRAANPVDALLCHLCHNLPFPCRLDDSSSGETRQRRRGNGSSVTSATATCLTRAHLAEIRRQQEEDEQERRVAGLYHRYALLAMQPYLERVATRMERIAGSNQPNTGEPRMAIAAAHDITMTPLLSALGLEGVAKFPGYAARLVIELWRSPTAGGKEDGRRKERGRELKGKKAHHDGLFVRVLYNGEDLTFHTTFCQAHWQDTLSQTQTHTPLCPLSKFLRFVRGEIFKPLNATSYQEACQVTAL